MRKILNSLLSILLTLILSGCGASSSSGVYDIMDYGAKGDGKTDDAASIQRAIDACSQAGGGTVRVPAGHTFLCSPFHLASDIDLHLEPNSRLLAHPDESLYTESAFGENQGEGMMWISAKDVKKRVDYRYRRDQRPGRELYGEGTGRLVRVETCH